MNCKHKYIGYNSDTKEYTCCKCGQVMDNKGYTCSDVPGVYKMTEKLYNDVIIEQLNEIEYAIRDGLVLGKNKDEVISLCKAIIELAQDRFCA